VLTKSNWGNTLDAFDYSLQVRYYVLRDEVLPLQVLFQVEMTCPISHITLEFRNW